MESFFVEILKVLFSRTDPVLVVVLIILSVLWYRTDRKINQHLSAQNKYPHPECQWGEKSYEALGAALASQHRENREDHQVIFNLLRGVPVPDHLLNRKSEDGTR